MSTPNQPLPARVPIPGSERAPLPGARMVAPVDTGEELSVSVYLRPKEAMTPELVQAPGTGELSREEFAARFGASREDLDRVAAFAKEFDLQVTEEDAGRRVVVLRGPAAAITKAFGVELGVYEHAAGSYRGRVGAVTVPSHLDGIISSVHGLDDRPQAQPHLRVSTVAAPRVAGGPYNPAEIAQAYNFPTASTGTGECVGIVELGGGYIDSDLAKFFADNGIPEPTVVSVGVDGAKNSPGDPADGEVVLDIEVVGAVAPGARIAVYFAPNTDQGFIDAVTTAAHDATNKPSVISISWGAAESGWSLQSMQAMDQAFQAAALMGVTVFAASGDNGAGDGASDGHAHADFPASAPHAVGCGGTTLSATGATITSEVVWNHGGGASGGGISDVFGVPSYQAAAGIPPSANPGGRLGRGVPDVAGDADPTTGYKVVLGGQTQVFGGTSAVAPLWAGLIARINGAITGHVGLIHPQLYAHPAAFRDITSGNNGAYQARTGWDACTGLGSPDGALVAQALAPAPAHQPGWSPLYSDANTLRSVRTAQNQDGRLEVFGINAEHHVFHTWQTHPGGAWSGRWSELYANSDTLTQLDVARNADGRLEVFGIDAQGHPRHTWQTHPNGRWSATWAELYTDANLLTSVRAGQNQDGRLEVFGINAQGHVFHTWQTRPGGAWSGRWAELYTNADNLTGLDVARNADGRLEAFGIDPNGHVRHTWQKAPNGIWNGSWIDLNADGTSLASVRVARNQDGRLEVFGVDAQGHVRHAWQLKPGGTWSSWAELYSDTDKLTTLAVEPNADGRLEVVGLDPQGHIRHTWQTQPNGSWTGTWTELYTDADTLAMLDAGRNADGRLEVVGVDADDHIRHAGQTAPGTW
ncbi:MAG: kumamolisin [Solirubrobacteraceae bacterium]|nr:kumamolisin [Solirubrobacteraceae bacterium]